MKLLPKDWYRSRSYLHFDLPLNIKKASKLVADSNLIAQHAFYPLIHYSIESVKIEKNPVTKKITRLEPKLRPISYSAHLDSHIYSYYSKILYHHYDRKLKENGLNDSIIAFRSLNKMSNIEFALDAFNEVKKIGECSVIALDISKFFDTLDHELLKKEWCSLLQEEKLPKDHFNVYKSITKHARVEKQTYISCWEYL